MNVAYIRVSTVEQNTGRQYADLEAAGIKIDRYFEEKISAKSTDRPVFQEMMQFVRDGDILYVESFSRLARNTGDLLKTLDILRKRNVGVVSLKEKFDTETATGRMMVTVIAAIATFERDLLLERQREGIAIAKKAGKYKGGKKKALPQNFHALYGKYLSREIKSKTELAKELGISRSVLYRFIEEADSKTP